MPLPAITPTGVLSAWITPVDSSAGTGITGQLSQDPGDTNAPIIFEPSPNLSGDNTEVWIIASGGANWGGCQVLVSLDTTTYAQIGTILSGASQGVLTATFPSGADPDTVNTLSVDLTESGGQLISGTSTDADFRLPTLAYCDGELVAFSAVTLTAPFNYDLDTYIRRGCYGTTIASHIGGTQFAWIRAPFAYDYPPALIGQTVYFKFPAFNTLGGELQDASTCTAYPYTLTGFGIRSLLWAQTLSVGSKITDLAVDPWDGNYELFDIPVPVEVTFPAGLSTSTTPGCEVAPGANVTLTLQKIVAGVPTTIGTIDITSGTTSGTYTFAVEQILSPGDRFRCYAPAAVDGTIAGLFATIVGLRTLAP